MIPDGYQPGSFRGAGFVSQRQEREGGRRVVSHEFPGRDEPLTEDLGRRARAFILDVFVGGNGESWFGDRDALIEALEAEGPGLLIHPWHGAMQVVVFGYRQSEDTSEGGIARFSIDFGESGLPVAANEDGTATALAESDAVAAEAPAEFASRFSVAKLPEFVEDAAARLVAGSATLTSLTAGVNGGVGPALRAFETGLAFLPGNVSTLLRTPLALGQAVVGLIQTVRYLGSPRQRIASFSAMAAYDRDRLIVPPRTPVRRAEAANRDAYLHLFSSVSASELVRTAVMIDLGSHDEASALRGRICDQLENLATAAADAGHYDRADLFDRLRRVLVRAIAAKAGSLARTHEYRPRATEPALTIANRLYGHGEVDANASDIVTRNAIRHPGFLPAAAPLKVKVANG